MSQWVVWLIIVILLALIEAMSINLTTVWFVASGICALGVSLLTDNYIIQFAVFVIVGVILLITTKPILVKHFNKSHPKTNADRVIGMTGIVTEKITKTNPGEVKVDGKRWTAEADRLIQKESLVRVTELNGVKLKVEKVKEGK